MRQQPEQRESQALQASRNKSPSYLMQTISLTTIKRQQKLLKLVWRRARKAPNLTASQRYHTNAYHGAKPTKATNLTIGYLVTNRLFGSTSVQYMFGDQLVPVWRRQGHHQSQK